MTPAARRIGALGAFAVVAASTLISLPARAAELDRDSRSITISVRIDPVECVTGCSGGGALPGTGLPATGLASLDPVAWIALALLVVGAALVIRARLRRDRGILPPTTHSTPYAVLSGARAPATHESGASRHSTSRRGSAGRRDTERGDGA